MDMTWLIGALGQLLGRFNPLKNIQHWKVWAELRTWYSRFKKWRDWYRDHILKPFQAEQQALQKLRDQFVMPVVKLIDHIRQLSSLIGIFNRKLAAKLNYQFLKVEGYLLKPFNDATSRINSIQRIFGAFLTPLGYFERGTLLNTIWRDAALIKEILHNPFEQHPPAATLPPGPTIAGTVNAGKQYLADGSGPFAADVNRGVDLFKELQAGG